MPTPTQPTLDETKRRLPWHSPNDPPIIKQPVLLLMDCSTHPLWIGRHNGKAWTGATGNELVNEVIGWMYTHEAFYLLSTPQP